MTTVNIHEAKTHLSKLLARVEAGEAITIAKAGRPMVDLVPHVRRDVVFGTLDASWQCDEAAFSSEADAEVATMFGVGP